jgi:hypothetical protein
VVVVAVAAEEAAAVVAAAAEGRHLAVLCYFYVSCFAISSYLA